MAKMLGGLSSRRYTLGLEPVGENVERAASATSKSAVSRRFVAKTETALAELLAAPLGNLDLVALMIDGVHFGEHLCVVALGIGIDGTKHPLGLVEGSTENTTVVTDLLTDLRGRGPGHNPSDPGRQRRRQGAARRHGGLPPPGDPTLPGSLCRPPDYADGDGKSVAGQWFGAGEVGIIRGLRARRGSVRVAGIDPEGWSVVWSWPVLVL